MYSQNDEEAHIVEFFGKLELEKPWFMDIGAYDGITFSNTLKLAELGWGGICVEPSPIPFKRLMEIHKDRPNVHLVHAALTPEENGHIIPFYDCRGDGVSTLIPAHVQRWQSQVQYQPYWVLTLPLSSFLQQFGTQCTFLNLDVESLNIQLFRALPLAKFDKLRMLCVEHDSHDAEIEERAREFGFRPIAKNPENVILVR